MSQKIEEIIKIFEKRLKDANRDQMTDFDDMNPKKFEGYTQAYEEVISELKNHVV